MKILVLFSFAAITLSSFANIEFAPPSFEHKGKKITWVDFKLAEYKLTYDVRNETALVVTTITFEQKEKGYPVFDSVTAPMSSQLNGENVKSRIVYAPGKVTKFRYMDKSLAPGTHTMKIVSQIRNGVRFKARGNSKYSSVSSAFFIRDLKDRKLLEKYLPTNFEYDNYKMIMDVQVIGTKRHHSLFVNGDKTKLAENHYRVEFPEYYVSSSVFFHLVPINRFVRWYLEYPSIDGRKIPVTIYSSYRFYNHYLKEKAWRVMKELEADYGAWPHKQLIIYGTGIKGGMEYAGATETSIVSLGHELQHAYYAKGIHPADGNTGWLDEAIASWRDKGHQTLEKPFYQSANLGAQSPYTRKTDKRSYEYGRSFMGYLDHRLKVAGKSGLKDFLRFYIDKRMHTSVTTEIFKKDLEEYSGLDFKADFDTYIYGTDEKKQSKEKHNHKENPHHPTIDEATLQSII